MHIKYLSTLNNIPVCLKVFKAKYIKNPNGGSRARFGFVNSSIHLAHYPDEESPINTFHKGISNICGLTVTQMRDLMTMFFFRLQRNNTIIYNHLATITINLLGRNFSSAKGKNSIQKVRSWLLGHMEPQDWLMKSFYILQGFIILSEHHLLQKEKATGDD